MTSLFYRFIFIFRLITKLRKERYFIRLCRKVNQSTYETTQDEGRADFYEDLGDSLFDKVHSNEPNFGLIHLPGQLYDPDPEMEAYIFNSSHLYKLRQEPCEWRCQVCSTSDQNCIKNTVAVSLELLFKGLIFPSTEAVCRVQYLR